MPTNITCASATLISTPLPQTIAVDNRTAGPSTEFSDSDCSSGNSYNALWWKFVCPIGRTRLIQTGTATDGGASGIIFLLTGDCSSLLYLTCGGFDGSETAFEDLTPGNTYWLLVTSQAENDDWTGTFTLDLPPDPTGDFCITTEASSATVSNLELNCNNHHLAIDGTNFTVNSVVELTGPDGLPVSFTILSVLPTRLLLDLGTGDLIPGQYCVTVI